MRQKMEKFLNLCEDYQTTKSAFTSAEQGAKVIVDTVTERIQVDRAQTAERVAELERLIGNGSRPASARKVWELELAQLKARTFSATPDERKAFDAEMLAAQEAVSDFGRLQREIREAISGVETEIKKCGRKPWEILALAYGGVGSKVTANHLQRFAERWAHE